MKYKFIEIQEELLIGIIHPKILINGIIKNKQCRLVLKVDNNIEDFNIKIINSRFYLEKDIKRRDRKVQLLVIRNGEEYVIANIKNRISRRIIYKLKYFFNKVFVQNRVSRRIIYKLKNFLNKVFVKNKLQSNNDSLFYNPFNVDDYNEWIKKSNKKEKIKKFSYEPLISVVIPVYNIERRFLKDCLDSILKQTYSNFEVCIADDHSIKQETIDTLKEYERKDKRIKVVYKKENEHISKATNSALKIAKGEFIAFMDDDDVITPNALYEVVKVLNKDSTLDLIYTDEDKMEIDGTLCDPHFKPDFSPDTLLGGNYISHFSIFRKEVLDTVGGLRSEYVGAQDFDLVLRFTEQTNKIYHIPKVLYHWRKIPGSTAVTMESKKYAIENGKKAVEEALKRRKKQGTITAPIDAAHYIVEYSILSTPKVSILIPTRDYAETLKKCLKSIYNKTTYKNFEVIVINNQSTQKSTFNLFNTYKKKHKNFRVIDADYPFNYSKINNQAVKEATGEYVILLNNDIEIITDRWIEIMLGYAMQDHIGAVGAKLLYSNGTIQHGGIILGVGGIAAHAYPGIRSNNYGTFGRLLIPYNYSAVTGACLMVRKNKYLQVGGLDENLAIAYNDVDFNMKLLEKGYYNIFIPQVKLIHYESKTRKLDISTEKRKRLEKESSYMKNKWKDKLKKDRFYNPNYSLRKDFMLDKK